MHFYRRKYFDDCILVNYLLGGREEAEAWAKANESLLTVQGLTSDEAALSTDIQIRNWETLTQTLHWTIPVVAQ